MPLTDKLNHIDYNWYIVRTKPGHEKELCSIIECCKSETKNILEAYCPTHTTVNVYHGGNERRMPLFDGYVFVLATQKHLLTLSEINILTHPYVTTVNKRKKTRPPFALYPKYR